MPEGRAGAQARPLLFLSALDAIIFLAAVAVNLETLPLSSSDLIQTLLIWSAVVLLAASAAGFAGGFWLGKASPSRIVVTAAAVEMPFRSEEHTSESSHTATSRMPS